MIYLIGKANRKSNEFFFGAGAKDKYFQQGCMKCIKSDSNKIYLLEINAVLVYKCLSWFL